MDGDDFLRRCLQPVEAWQRKLQASTTRSSFFPHSKKSELDKTNAGGEVMSPDRW